MAYQAIPSEPYVPTSEIYVANGGDPTKASMNENNPQKTLYSDYSTARTADAATFSMNASELNTSLTQNVYDPWGPASRANHARGGLYKYHGPYVNPYDSNQHMWDTTNNVPMYNHMFMTIAQNFDPFMQKRESLRPNWWLNRVPRGAFPLFDGVVHETRIYRGGLSIYSGLSDWEPIVDDPTSADACKAMDFSTYQYGWETLSWSGKKTAWGSDPICVDVLKFTPKAQEQLGWILETGVRFGTAIQNVWNRDMFIFYTVTAGRSYVMTSEYRGAAAPRYVYQPFCKFGTTPGNLVADKTYIDKPFIVIDASVDMEPLNFDVLDIVRNQLKRRCPDAAVGRIGSELMFALAVSEEDIEKYIRGNEEERRYWIEANPQALINHYGFAPTTFRRWTITCDPEQLRFKLVRYIDKYTTGQALNYGHVGEKEFSVDANDGKPVWIAKVVDPEIPIRAGINGSPIPGPNPEYDMAEIAIAPVFMNKIFTNLFVPDAPQSFGHETYFGPKKGLNGKWSWRNIISEKNPDGKIGNFYGEFHIVPKPDLCVYDCISFVYRRCTEALKARCPVENYKINPDVPAPSSSGVTTANPTTTVVAATKNQAVVVENIPLNKPLAVFIGDTVKISGTVGKVNQSVTDSGKATGLPASGWSFTSCSYDSTTKKWTLTVTPTSGSAVTKDSDTATGQERSLSFPVTLDDTAYTITVDTVTTVTIGSGSELDAYVFSAPTQTVKSLQITTANVLTTYPGLDLRAATTITKA